MNRWKEIWNGKENETKLLDHIKNNVEDTVLELKKLDGWDSTSETITFEAFRDQFIEMKNELSWNAKQGIIVPIKSVFEVGCGAGPSLYMFENYVSSIEKTGGVDYSGSLLEQASHVLNKVSELYEDEAINIDTKENYTCVFANSVFSYFTDLDYAYTVLDKMLEKSEYSIGILALHDIDKKEDFLAYRRSLTPDYDEKYKGLDKLFYPKTFFVDFAAKNGLDIKICRSDLAGYWNNPFLFNVYLYKN